ncbi:hypothetical protein GCM10025875_33240 [Litorihabitans aurantiacus]|uniref:Sugar phosphate isomerase/epimerase n=2 Tax=Litorihabitans aurantiacus TaxID=1930061 RepID=A0AA37XHB2_9MICO|nr:hypothetical protein GCM10025875_33240 [Litorihabitans aurantiacus]
MPPGMNALCTLRGGTTPNVDKLVPQIDLTTNDDFGLGDNFLTHARANLTVAEGGAYEFRITSDDGSRLTIGDEVVLDNDGPQDTTSVEGTVQLEAGVHDLFVEHFDGTNNQRLLLEWRPPGAASFAVVPSSVLSTEADVVRVTAPGTKYCEGAEDTAGDGLQLDSVNPNYTLTDLRPADFEPKVSGLAFDDADRLLVSTTGSVSSGGWVPDAEPGEVFALDNVLGETSAAEVEYTKIASDLFNPMGIAYVDGKLYASERDGLTELSDLDGDGFYEDHRTFATWPDGGNFHEFAFGLIHDEENFYVNLSVAINNGGASTNPQPAADRGTTLRIDRETGEVEYVAGGLRTPNGIGFGPENEIFAMDNQGDWLPSSKLVHVKDGRFFNHYTNPAGRFDDQPVTPPALWLPQNDISNSPSTPITLEAGPFAGQMLFGDVTYGGLQRAFLEEVDGEYQGAAFRHTAGLEVGANRVITGPDGALYVGGTGEGGNWGESGKLRYGLQKLTPVNADTFDMTSVSVVEGGFEITYTEPISTETAESIADAYRATQWRYVPTAGYGGPKVDETGLVVSDAVVSEDRTKVTLQLDGLEPGHVVHLRSPRPFESESGKELWSTEAWYTLNSLPGYEAPADRGWYEAEYAALRGNAGLDTEHNGYSGAGFVDNFGDVGTGVTFTVNAEEAGTQPLHLRYANGPNPFVGDKDVSLYVNGERIGPWTLPPTGAWNQWGTATTEVALEAGANAVSIRHDEGDDGHVNLDLLQVGDGGDICLPAETEDGYRSLFDGTLATFADWNMAGPGSFGRQADCSLRTSGGMGLLWHGEELGEYSLKLDWKLTKDDNGGIFVGFPDPGTDPWVAVNQGYEIQIDATDEDDRTTGAIYTFQGADLAAVEASLNPVGEWNAYEIVVQDQTIQVYLNGTQVNDFTSTDPARDLAQGFIGMQNHGAGEAVNYRNVRVMDLEDAVTVTAEPVTFTDEDGTEADTFTVPAVEGVEYLVDGDVVAAGTYPGAGTVTVTARALAGFVLAGETEWSYTFDATTPEPEPVLIPAEQVSMGMFSLSAWANQDGLPVVLDRLETIGFENIEPFGGTLRGFSAEQFRAMADSYGLDVPSSHYDVGEATFANTLAYVKTLGQRYVGSGGFAAPGIGSLENTLTTADTMDRLGALSVANGTGKFFGHNHAGEFTTMYEYNGEMTSAWEILVAETDPELVTFQVDVAWATHAGIDVPELLEEHGDRIDLLHIKDATGLVTQPRPTFVNLGEGDVPLQEILAEAVEQDVDLYVMEYDGSPANDSFSAEGFEYLTGLEAGEANPTPEPYTVTPAAVTATDVAGTTGDTYTVPSSAGVQYLVGDAVVAAGTYPATGTVTVTARAATGYALAQGATAEWTFTFDAAGDFVDVPEGMLFFEDIQWMFENGISTGWETADGREYRPLQPIARDAMAAFLYRQANSPAFTAPTVSPFSDVATDNQFYKEIAWLADQDISTGWDNGDGTFSFRPLEPINRDAMAAFLYRMADSPEFEAPAVSPFTDLTPSTQFYSEITWLASEGITTGWLGNDGTAIYRPVNPINRDAMAAFLHRYDDAGFSNVGGSTDS